MPYTITKIFKVDIAERHWTKLNEDVRGKEFYRENFTNEESNIHGHTLFIHITLESASLDQGGFVLDTDVIKTLFSPIFNQLDHSFIIATNDPLYDQMKQLLPNGRGLKLYEVNFIPTFENLSHDLLLRGKKILQEAHLTNEVVIKQIKVVTPSIEGGFSEENNGFLQP